MGKDREVKMSDDPRLGDILKQGDDGSLVLLGYPCDLGVARNKGRVGAQGGPDAVRKQLKRLGTVYNPELDIDLSGVSISDGGNVDVSDNDNDFEKNHETLRKRVGDLIKKGSVPFVIGGANEKSVKIGVINIDAHFDVRPLLDGKKAHSGSPFRQLLEDDRFDGHNFVEFAAQGNQCSAEHLKYLHSKHAEVVWMSQLSSSNKPIVESFTKQLDNLSCACGDLFVSFDIDAISGADAPGVSCVASYGLSAHDALQICFAAGKNEKVSLFDLSEFNPSVEEHRTARLVANMFYYFALGYATRSTQRLSRAHLDAN